jgi:hypothetical protein
MKRREDPTFTYEQAGEIEVGQIVDMTGDDAG